MGVLFNTARNAASDGLLSTREVGKIISKALDDGRVHQGEVSDLKKIQTEFYDELTPQARRAIRNFLSLGNTFDPGIASQIFGVTDDVADKLERANIKTKQELLLASRTPDMRAAIAGAAGIDEVIVTSLAEQADLARTVGVGVKYAAILQKVGINDVQELADQNAVALRRQITSFLNTTEGRKVTSRRPSLKSVKKWIQGAKALPRMMKQLGDSGADFNKAAFDKLPQYQQHMLLMGWDVRVNSGFVFDDAQLEITQVLRKPRALGDAIRGLEDSAFSGDYESAELEGVERLKVDDELVGYRATFDVVTEGTMDGELAYSAEYAGDSVRMRGTVDVTFDEDGNILGREDYLDYDYNHE